MRVALIILCMTAVALTLVRLRRERVMVQYEVQRHQQRLIEQRREFGVVDVELGMLTSPDRLRARARSFGLALAPPGSEWGLGMVAASADGVAVGWNASVPQGELLPLPAGVAPRFGSGGASWTRTP